MCSFNDLVVSALSDVHSLHINNDHTHIEQLKMFIKEKYLQNSDKTSNQQQSLFLFYQCKGEMSTEGKLKATHATPVYQWLLTTASGHESTNAASDDGSADGAVTQAGGTVATHHQMTTGDEDDGHQFVHAHLAGPLLLQLP